VAEGEKQAVILRAEGSRQATILQAEADREAARLRAEGAAMGLNEIYRVAQGVDSKTLTLQYLDALRALGATQATKFVIPTEFVGLARQLANHASKAVAEPDGEG